MDARQPAVAGTFYPGNGKQLRSMIDGFLADCSKKAQGELKGKTIHAIIVPHAGYVYSGIVAASAYSILAKSISRAIIMGPSHFIPVLGGAFDDHPYWKTPLGDIEVKNFPSLEITIERRAHSREHSIEVQVPFLQAVLPKSSICPISIGAVAAGQDESIAGELIKQLDGKTLLIASSDLSHYYPYDEAVKLDKKTISSILSLKDVDDDLACGSAGVNILVNIARRLHWRPVLLDYRNSGDTSGSRDEVVGYCAIAFVT